MKKTIYRTALAASLLLSPALLAQDEAKENKETPAAEPAAEKLTQEEMTKRISLGIGFQSGMQAKGAGLKDTDIDAEQFLAGFTAALKGEELSYSDDEIRAAFTELQNILTERENQAAEANKAAGEKFLADNGKREGVTTTESGLQYEVLTKGEGEKFDPAGGENKLFMVHYKGTLPDGTDFDASDGENPVPFPLNGVIPGFSEALKLMPVGSKYKLFIPSDLAYGAQRRSAEIGPHQVLVFELELVEIKDAPQQQNPGFSIPGQPQAQ
ncbi:MAG: FKBP-type peptidyl-prolyl cis-trans isomerase N-terminal domain-containing protein [Verrucomicrobiales bacterium]